MQDAWNLVATLLGGTTAMRHAGEQYLPKWPNEDPESYQCRLQTATLFPAFSRTVETLTGKPFSKPLKVNDDVPPRIAELLADVDLQGRNLHSFAADMMQIALGYGLGGILVEFPRAEGIKTLEQERAAGVRPYFVAIRPQQLLGWKSQRVNGKEMLTQLRFMECVEEDEGDYGTKVVDQVRVLKRDGWETHRKNARSEWELHEQGKTTIGFIPFVPVYGARTAFMTAKPPLIELAHMNVKHWQSQSDQDTLLHVARVPVLTVIGGPQGMNPDGTRKRFELTIGASAAVELPQGADLKYVEHSGKAIEAGKVALDDLKEEMRQAGAELLVIKPGDMTATEASTENAVAMCALQRITNDLKDALDLALSYMAAWIKEPKGGSVTLFTDFGAATLADASAQLLLSANIAGKISDETLRGEFKRRAILSPEVNEEEEKQRLEEQGPALGEMGEDDADGKRAAA
ncbi:hypothetical protein AAW51_2135 [Caldimonas brevitalea]|uniref:DUF4055 domain-containing protein n=2 Tax=Caldimonas brevitalea TaxID=413882 RepID=A0A0G3BNA1_9BURK|nr:hypothetical protein AAW51_2135 [Caldimonas brevitalea]